MRSWWKPSGCRPEASTPKPGKPETKQAAIHPPLKPTVADTPAAAADSFTKVSESVHGCTTFTIDDPSHPGRFAIMTPGRESELLVFTTDSYGESWKGPIRAGRTPGADVTRPDIAYSSAGTLALMWLAVNRDRSYTAWSAISRDGGTRFSPPLKVSRAPSPSRASIRFRGNNWDGDDLSSLAVDDEFVHIVWADGRAGFLGAWYARVPLASY